MKAKALLSHLPDALAVTLLLALGRVGWAWEGAPGLPFWASLNDRMLAGPDAGEWAANAQAFVDGRWSELDMHRMPTWQLLIAAGMTAGHDVILSGHLVNHLLHWVLPVVLYALGSGWGAHRRGSRVAGLAAGLLVIFNPRLVWASRAFGVDIAVATLIPVLLLTASWAGRWWWLGPLAGVIGGAVATTHFTTLPFPLCGLAMILLAGRGWARVPAALGYALGVWAWTKGIFQIFPFPDPDRFQLAIQEGITPGAGTQVDTSWARLRALAGDDPMVGVDAAIRLMLHTLIPAALPWKIALILPWLGVAGLALRTPADTGAAPPTRWQRLARWLPLDLGAGLAILTALAPLPLLAAAQTPERYSFNLLPVVAVLMGRGLASPFALLDTLVRSRLPAAWPVFGGVGAAAALWLGDAAWVQGRERIKNLPPPMEGQLSLALGEALAALVPPGGGAATPLREAALYAGRSYCPETGCPMREEERAYLECLAILDMECGGEGPVPYVVIDWPGRDLRTGHRPAMDAWVQARWTPAKQVIRDGFSAEIFLIDREEIHTLHPGKPRIFAPPPGQAVPPPPGVAPPPTDPSRHASPQGQPTAPPLGQPGPNAAPLGPDGRPLPAPR